MEILTSIDNDEGGIWLENKRGQVLLCEWSHKQKISTPIFSSLKDFSMVLLSFLSPSLPPHPSLSSSNKRSLLSSLKLRAFSPLPCSLCSKKPEIVVTREQGKNAKLIEALVLSSSSFFSLNLWSFIFIIFAELWWVFLLG